MSKNTFRPGLVPPTNKFLHEVSDRLSVEKHRVLDIGGTSDFALHLADQGHRVVRITSDKREAYIGRQAVKHFGIAVCEFIELDPRNLRSRFVSNHFSAVVMKDTLQAFDKQESLDIIDSIKQITRPNGLNALHEFLVDPIESISPENRFRMFYSGELAGIYLDDPQWMVQSSYEDPFQAEVFEGKELVQSHADLLARKLHDHNLPHEYN